MNGSRNNVPKINLNTRCILTHFDATNIISSCIHFKTNILQVKPATLRCWFFQFLIFTLLTSGLEQLIISKRQTVKKWVELNLPIFYFAIIFVKKIERSVDYKR